MVCEKWEGLTVDGRFPLLEWLRGSTDRCVFLTVRQATQEANIKLIIASGTDADEFLANWEVAKAQPHPSLVQMMETGRSTVDGSDVVFAVTEKADTFLSGLIPRKALNADTVKEILDPIVDALSFVHDKGFTHGSVKPANIVQIGDSWKLASDEMVAADAKPARISDTYDAPEFTERRLTPAADMWSLGIIAIEAFAQKTPMWDRATQGDLGVPDWMPEPFREIARRCLRWEPAERISVAEFKALLAQHVASPDGTASLASALRPAESAPAMAEPTGTSLEIPETEEPPAQAASKAIPPPDRPVVKEKIQEKVTAPPALAFEEEEPVEFTPRSRLFGNLEEGEERRSTGWIIFFGVVALVVVAAVLAVRGYWSEFWRPAETQNPPQASQPAPQAQTPQAQTEPSPSASSNPGQAAPLTPSQVAPGESKGATPGATPSQSPPSSAQSAPSTPQPPPQVQAPAERSNSSSAVPSQTEKPQAPEQKSRETERDETAPRIENAKGAVVKRVLPSVAPGASESMRRPVRVEIRVFVNEAGSVANAETLTQGPGNYFARVAHQAARSWKFKAPVSGGRSRDSEWILLFHFERRSVDVIATEVR